MVKNIVVTWGGEDDTETLADALAALQNQYPGAKLTKTEWTSGGWPVYEVALTTGGE